MNEYKNYLLKLLPTNTKVFTKVVRVSNSGMSRDIKFYVIHDWGHGNEIVDITYNLVMLKVAGGKASRGFYSDCLNVKGCGMNIPFHCIEWLSKELNINLIHREL
jgi:hypothetical protein